MQMSTNELKVYQLIVKCDRENPIKDKKIADQLGLSTREVADLVKRLIEIHKIPIGGSREKPFGRYMILTTDELKRYQGVLHATASSIFHRIKALDDAFVTTGSKQTVGLGL